jgi:hypothetical protein
MMAIPPVNVERRAGQRFCYHLPVSVRDVTTAAEGLGFTQDLSSRGAFLFTAMAVKPGAKIELTLKMPSEITLGESMRVRCRGRVLRVVDPLENIANHCIPGNSSSTEATLAEAEASASKSRDTKIGVAVCFEDYSYLPEAEDPPADFRRVSALHDAAGEEPTPREHSFD